MPVTINQGTQTSIQTDAVGTNQYQIVKLDYGAAGASSLFTGTIPELTNLVKGTINNVGTVAVVNNGTLGQVGTLVAGTVDTIGLINANYFATTVFTGTSTLGTIKTSPGVGTRVYVTDFIVSVGSASNVVLADGAANVPLSGTMFFASNGGIVANLRTPLRTSQGGTLVFQQSAAIGSCTVTCFGYTAP